MKFSVYCWVYLASIIAIVLSVVAITPLALLLVWLSDTGYLVIKNGYTLLLLVTTVLIFFSIALLFFFAKVAHMLKLVQVTEGVERQEERVGSLGSYNLFLIFLYLCLAFVAVYGDLAMPTIILSLFFIILISWIVAEGYLKKGQSIIRLKKHH